jgi:hypothetical protein
MSETISVAYEYLGTVFGRPFYHESLLFTGPGFTMVSTAWPSIQLTPTPSDVIEGVIAAEIGGQSPWGTIGGYVGTISLLPQSWQAALNQEPSEILETGNNLSSQWSAITEADIAISSAGIPYSLIEQNSNSAAFTELLAANIQEPADSGPLGSKYWTPGSGNLLSIPIVSTDMAEQAVINESIPSSIRIGSALTTELFEKAGDSVQSGVQEYINTTSDPADSSPFMTNFIFDSISSESFLEIENSSSILLDLSVSSTGLESIGSYIESYDGSTSDSNLEIFIASSLTAEATVSNEILISTGDNDVLNAGTNNNTLIAFTGTIGNYVLDQNPSYNNSINSTTEIVEGFGSGSISTNNTLYAWEGNNTLIGDGGINTFVMAPSLTGGTNIIYGGGGTSTYEVYGTVEIVYTHDSNPTVQEIENLSLASGTGDEPLTYIVDPGANDVIETPDGNLYSGAYLPTIEPEHITDVPRYVQKSDTPVTNNIAYNPSNPYGYTGTFIGNAEIWDVGPENGTIEIDAVADTNDNPVDNTITLVNFVNGDLGINFEGSLALDVVANGGAEGSAGGGLYDLVIPDGPGNVFNYTSKTYVGSASSGSGGNNSSGGGSNSSGSTNNSTSSLYPVISGGVTKTVSAGNSFVGASIDNGGMLIVAAGGSELAATVSTGGVEAVRGGSAEADGIDGGTEYVSAGGQVLYNRVSDGYNGSAFVSGQEIILSGGVVSGNNIEYGGEQIVRSGGLDQGSTIESGLEVVSSGGRAVGDSVVGDSVSYSGAVQILSGGIVNSLSINMGSAVVSGGTLVAATLNGGNNYGLGR